MLDDAVNPDLGHRIARLASDRESGASELLEEAIAILRVALERQEDVLEVARAVSRAQPTMASMWSAALTAVAAVSEPERFRRFVQRVARAPAALARFGVEALEDHGTDPGHRVQVVTLSFSRSVEGVLVALAARRPLGVSCSEGRPALEGRRLASRLVEHHIPVTFYSDAAIGQALQGADAVVIGADAVTPHWFVNKSGTRLLVAAAGQQAVPVYVVASRDKFVSGAVASALRSRDGDPSEIWDGAPAAVEVRNPYFERTSVDELCAVISDVGVLGSGMIAAVCESVAPPIPPGFLP
jgi:translation initiation factor 2B subunit (eIF-2B alpha/beta/delta family)